MRITLDVNVNLKGTNETEVIELLNKILKQNTNMAKSIADLSAKADELQTSLDAVQAKVQENTATLTAEIQELKDIIAAGGSGAEIDAVFEKLDATLVDLNSTFPPVEPTPE